MTTLAEERCEACRPDSQPVSPAQEADLLGKLDGWSVAREGSVPILRGSFAFADFASALAFTNAVGALAEAADHHPRIVLEWGRVDVAWWTHAIGGLHRNDFIMAARTSSAFAAAG